MRILTRYLLRAHIGPFLFALFALTGILFVNTVARRYQDLAGKGLPLSVVLEVFYLSLPHILALTLPMAVLVAALYAFAQMSADNEITALKASGVSLFRLIMPLVFVAVLFTGFMLWFNDSVLPDTNHRLKNLVADVSAKTPTLQLTEQVINPIRTNDFRTRYWLRAGRIDDETQRLYDVVIYDMSNARKSRTIYADSGAMYLNPAQTDMRLTLFDGVVHEVDEFEQEALQRVFFAQQHVELRGVGTELERRASEHRTDREMSVAMLKAVVDSAQRELARVRSEAQELHLTNLEAVLEGPAGRAAMGDSPAFALDRYDPRTYGRAGGITEGSDEVAYRAALDAQRLANQARTFTDLSNQYRVEYHKKFAIPFACIIFVLLGAPLALRFPRGGVGMVIAASFAIFGIYYMSLIGGESLGDRGTINPIWGPWAPNLLFGLIGLWTLSRIGREKATSRGGGWDDVVYGARRLFSRPFRRRRGTAAAASEA
ncbi:MAG TPA: LptF/LptG family permease [Longimicrobiales bacterium]|nr:LptF/LptG family permease [Longimicrobiales bacterium]